MELNKENLLEMLKEYVKEHPISYYQTLYYWSDFIEWLDTRSPTLHEAKSGGAQVDDQDKPENDRPKACLRGHHYANENGRPFDFFPDCGERLSS